MAVIVPKSAAPGKPWVFRADPIGRDAAVDQALLAKGFHIVVAPLIAQAGPVRSQWDATYKRLVDHGFSRKPVMEGAGTAAGEAYAWAIENPDKVSCIYAENPALRSLMSKTPPLDHLDAAGQGRRADSSTSAAASTRGWRARLGSPRLGIRELAGQSGSLN